MLLTSKLDGIGCTPRREALLELLRAERRRLRGLRLWRLRQIGGCAIDSSFVPHGRDSSVGGWLRHFPRRERLLAALSLCLPLFGLLGLSLEGALEPLLIGDGHGDLLV